MSLKGGRKNFFKILFVISEKSSQLVSEGKNLTNLENRMGKQHIECVLLCSLIYTILNYTTGRKFFKDQPELLRRYERNEARYILQLPKNYDTISIDFGIDKNEMKRLVIALAELDLTIDEWLCFKMKELILADRLSKENRGEE